MTKIITCAELRHRRLEELQALFRSFEIELLRTEPGSFERTTALANLENVSRAMAICRAAPCPERCRRHILDLERGHERGLIWDGSPHRSAFAPKATASRITHRDLSQPHQPVPRRAPIGLIR